MNEESDSEDNLLYGTSPNNNNNDNEQVNIKVESPKGQVGIKVSTKWQE